MKVLFAIIGFLAISLSSEALLPPLFESTKEITAILNDKELASKLQSGELITKIERNEAGFGIITNKHSLQVDVQYLHTGRIGPAEYKLNFHEPIPLTK